ncbi:hypothetical protein C7N43_34635 [Sphingobacteriales bacterium UPWRP_1]|nr:hypothetical protein C7N43_34635 [Sphingobacteriales bacterium UPWRP_1]
MENQERQLIIQNATAAARGVESLEKLTATLVQINQQYQNSSIIISALVNATATPVDNVVNEILGLVLPALANSVKEINGIVAGAKSNATTPEQKALYHVQAEGRIEDATAGLRQYLWTLYYKGQA